MPPVELIHRVGRIEDEDVAAGYEAVGLHSRRRIERLLTDDWSWEGKRVLDFGCGAGRTLRHFLAAAEDGEFFGCDIDRASITWAGDHLSPPFHFFGSNEQPFLPQPDHYFDLVYALSVFTHITDEWAGWLLELHRVLKPEGLLIATFLNEGMWPNFGRGDWDENRIGMTVLKKWNPWDSGGPIVFHSEWWIREHWGRAFDVLALERHDPHDDHFSPPSGQGAVVLRPRPDRPDAEALRAPANDSRELAALQDNVEQLQQEASELFDRLAEVGPSYSALAAERESLSGEVARLCLELDEKRGQLAEANDAVAKMATSRSWRLTAPLRAGRALLAHRSKD
jgi:SAM-dependent methyltransferase